MVQIPTSVRPVGERLFWSNEQLIQLSEKQLSVLEHQETPNTRKKLAMKSSIC